MKKYQRGEITDTREYKDRESYMNRNRNGIKLHGLDTGGKVKGGIMKQEAADTKYSMKHKESNIRKKLKPLEYEMQQAYAILESELSAS